MSEWFKKNINSIADTYRNTGNSVSAPEPEGPGILDSLGNAASELGEWYQKNMEENMESNPMYNTMNGLADRVLDPNQDLAADSDTYTGSLANAIVRNAAGTGAGLASMFHADTLADRLNAVARNTEDREAMDPSLSLEYITNPHGLTRSTGEVLGSVATLLPFSMAVPESATMGIASLAGRAGLNRGIQALINRGQYGLAKRVAETVPDMVQWGLGQGLGESLAEGGSSRTEALAEGLGEDEATRRSLQTAALNFPLLATSNMLEGGLLKGLLNVPARVGAKAIERYATAPLRAVPSALANAAQNGAEEFYQEAIQAGVAGRPYGLTPFTGTDEQIRAAKEGFAGSLLLGGVGGTANALRDGGREEASSDLTLDQMWENIQRIQGMIDSAEMQRSQETASDTTPSPSIQTPQEAAYTIANEVSNPTVTDLTEAKLRLLDRDYYNKYGRHFYITSMSREGNPDDSWHNTGQAFDTADDLLESDAEARAWLIERGKAYGLYGLDEYEHPSEHATGGHIHFSDHGEELSGDYGNVPSGQRETEDLSRFSDKQREAWQEAQWVESQTGIPADYVYRQWAHESENFTSRLARENNNFGGLTQTTPNGEENKQPDGGNYYRMYNNMHEYAESYVNDFINRYDGKENVKTMEDFVNFLHSNGYFTANPADYLADMQGIDAPSSRSPYSPASTSSHVAARQRESKIDTHDDELNSMYEGFIREQLEASRNTEDISFFDDMFTEKGKFKNTEENIEKIRERVNGDLAEDFADYVQRQRERQQNAIADVPSGAVQGSQEAPKIEAKTSNLDAIKSRLDSMREEAIGRGDFDLVTKINKAVRTNNVEAMRKLSGPMEVTPVETTQAPNVISQPTQNVSLQETTAPQNQTVGTTQHAEAQTTPNPRMSSQGQISPAETMEEPSIPQSVTQPEASREQVPTQAESIQRQNSTQDIATPPAEKAPRQSEYERLSSSIAKLIDIDLANGDETAANEKYAAIVNHDIPTMKEFLSQGRYDYLTLLNRVNTAFGKVATGRHSKKDRIRQGKALMQLARGEDLKSMGVNVAFPEDVNAGLKRGDSRAIEKAIGIFNDAGIHSIPFARYAKSLQAQETIPETAEPSRERRMQNESAETTSTETPVPAQNQDQYAQPGQAEQEAQEVAPENNERPVDDGQEIPSQNAPRPAGEAIEAEGNHQVPPQAENAPRNETQGESTQEANPSGEDQSGESDWVNELATRPVENPENLSLSQVEYRLRKLRKARQQDIDDEVERMKQTPGGKGVTIGYTYDERENINGRWAESNNPEWYRRAYKQYGRKPPKSAYPQIAEESLKDIQEFGERDIEIARLEKLRNQLKEQAKEQPTNGERGKSAQNTANAANEDGGQENERKDAKRNEKIGSFSVGKTGKKFTATLDESLGREYAKDHAEAIDTLAESFGGKGKDGTYTFGTKRERDGFLECANAYIALQKSQGNLEASASAEAKRIREIVWNMKIVPVKEYSKLHTMLSNLGEAMGCPIVWVDASSQLDGVHCNGVTFLNRNAGMDLVKTFWHEQFHWIVANNNALANELLSYFQGKNGLTKQQLEKYRNDHNRHDLTDENTVWEVLADEFVEVSKRDPMLRKMAGENPSLAQRFVAWIKRMMDRVAEMFHNPDGRFTTKQRDAFVERFGKLAGSLKDGKGKPLFKTYQNGRKITLANGDSLLSKLLDMVENPLYDIAGIKLSAAWHGSPHEFDKFSLDAIGTGEGAQVHGWGLYFAKEREVSEGYRSLLVNQDRPIYDTFHGKELSRDIVNTMGILNPNRWAAQALIANNYDVDASISYLERLAENKNRSRELSDAIKGGATALRRGWVKPGEARRKGSLLQVEIPDEDVMLDEQKTFEEQPEKVQKALRRLISESETAKKHTAFAEQIYESNGGKIYGIVVGLAEGDAPRNANFDDTHRLGSELLNQYGIKGITYEGGTDGRCYVVFDDDSIEITARFSVNADVEPKFSFAGENSETTPVETLEQAKEMDGKTNSDEIYMETGWIKGKDGKWRYEIPDNLDKIDIKKLVRLHNTTLGEIYDNPELFAAYPELRNLDIGMRYLGDSGNMGRTVKRIFDDAPHIQLNEYYNYPGTLNELKKTLVHEVQHVIQGIEGFSKGGNKEQFSSNGDTAAEAYRKYTLLGGEQEAREVEDRAEQHTYIARTVAEAQQRYDEYKKSQPKQVQKLMDEAYRGGSQKAYDALPEDIQICIDDLEIAKSTLPTPIIHSDDAIIVFGNKEFSAKFSLNLNSNTNEHSEPQSASSMPGNGDATDPSSNSTPSLLQRVRNILTGRVGSDTVKYQYRQRLTEMLGDALGVKIRYGKLSAGDGKNTVVYKERDKVIRSSHAYDWENILPVAGGLVAKRLGLKATDGMKNYIAKWILTGNPNNVSQEADDFHEAMQKHPHFADRMLTLRETFQEWNDKEEEAQAQGVIQWEKPDKTSWKDRKKMLYDDLFESLGPVERLVKAATERMGKKKLDAIVDPAVAFRLFRGYYGRAITMIEGEGQKAVEGLKRNFPGVDFTGFKTLHTILKEIDAFQNKERQKSFITYCTARHLLDMHGKNDQLARDKQEAADDVTARENAWREVYRSLGEEKKRLSALEKNVAALENAVNSNSRDTVASKEALDEMKQDLKEARKAVKEKQKTVDKLFRELGQARKRVDDLDGKKPMEIPEAYSKENCEKIIQKGDEEFRQAQQDLVHFSNTTAAILYDSGVISAKRYRSLMETWPNYVPLHRVFEENEEIDFGDSLQKIKGSQRDIVNPLESIIRNTVDFVKRAEKNKAKCLLADLARCDGTGWLIEEVEDTKPGDKTTITFYENGERKYLQTDPAVVKAINSMDRRNSNAVMKFLHAITSVARACFTMASPEFAMRNIFRDYADAVLYNKNGFISPMDMIRGFMNALHKDETYYEWLSSGAAQASAISLDRNYTQEMIDKMGRSWGKRFMSKSFPQAILEALQKAGEYSEYATRIAMYTKNKEHLSARESKGDAYAAIIGAAFESRDLMDFARKGEGGDTWNKLVPFANASLQGLNKFYREALDPVKWRENPKEMTRTWARLIISSILPAMMLFLWNKDEDWYKELPDWVKEGHWVFKLGDTVIRIPKGSDVGIRFLSNAVEKGMAEVSKRDSYKAKDYFRPLWDALPNFIPIAMLPLLEASLNKSTFTGRNIVPQHQEKLPEKLQYGPYTTGFSKVIGEKLGIAPRKIDHVIAGYGGSLGMFPFKAADVLWGDRQLDTSMEEMPLTRSLLYMPYKNPRSVQKYYELLDEQTKLENEYKLTHVLPKGYDPALLRRLKETKKRLDPLAKEEKSVIDNKNYSVEQRKARQMAIQQRRIRIVERIVGK